MKSPALTALLGACLLVSPAFGTILLNEIHIDPPPDLDLNYEYVELRSTTGGIEACTGLTLLVIENNGGQVGEVEEALNLNDFSTGANGLLLLGNGYDSSPQGGPWSGFKSPTTAAGDPTGTAPWSGMGDDDLDPNGGLTFLLVSGWTGMSNADANTLGDVDVNNNSILDWLETPPPATSQSTQPFTALVDSIGYPDLANSPVRRPYTSTAADLNRRATSPATFAPDNISRRLSRVNHPADANNAMAWYGGRLAGTAANSIAYDVQFFGDFKGQATPGQPNLDSVPVVGDFLINEVAINPVGSFDGNYEYIELVNAATGGGSASLQGLALIILRSNDSNGAPSLGIIREAWDLSTFSTGANGLLLLGNGYPEGNIPWASYIDPQTQLAEPAAPATQNPIRWSSMGDDDIASNDGFTILLVQNFTGTIDQDLDTNNDGVLDVTPWTAIKDSVGFDQLAPGIGKTYAQANIVPSVPYEIGNLSRKLGTNTANSAGAWYGGDYGGNSQFGISFRSEATRPVVGGFRGSATPGRINLNAAAAPAPIRLNEVHVDPVGESAIADEAYEYVEFANVDNTIGVMSGLTLVLANGSPGAQNGKILQSIDLGDLSTGPNGLLVMGDGYDATSPYDAPFPLISRLTAKEDPQMLDEEDIGPNEAVLILLTKGTPPAVDSNVAAIPAADIVDSIGFGTSPNPSVAMFNANFVPDNLSRYPGNLNPNAANSWYAGELDASQGAASLAYGANFSGTFKGEGSPGRYNHAATPNSQARVLINEVNINPPGGDASSEFVEFQSVPGSATSTNGYTLLLLDSTGTNTGAVLEAWSLDGMSTGANGLLLIGAGYPGTSPWVDANAPDPNTRLGSPQLMSLGEIAGDSDNGAMSLLLVKYFTGYVGQDLDDGVPVTGVGANDGTLDLRPWTDPIVDAVGLRLWDTSLTPANWSGRIYGGVDLSQSLYTPDNISRQLNSTTPNNKDAWYGGDIAGTEATASNFDLTQKFPSGPFVGMVTAGRRNVGIGPDDMSDDDNDGVVYLIEAALNMNPTVSDPQKLPQTGTVELVGTVYPTLSYTRFLGGTVSGSSYTANGYRYEVEVSVDMVAWTTMTTYVTSMPTGDSQTETAFYRPDTAYLNTALASGGKVFLRLKISRS